MTTNEMLAVLGGRYRLRRRIGRGASAEVWAATDERLGRDVAVKLFVAGVDDMRGRDRVEAEMRLLGSLRHPRLVTVHDAGFHDDRPYLVMELVRGPSLRGRLAAGPMDRDETTAIGAHVAEALACVHAAGAVHRDVKPANILLEQPPGQSLPAAFLADFGIARMDSAPRLTAAGTIVGTAHYLSPEQVRGADVGPASDVYSLGLVLLECLTGSPSYDGTGVESAIARLHRDPEMPTGLDAPLRDLLAEMTARDASSRPTAAVVASRLGDAMPVAASDQNTAVLPALPLGEHLRAGDADTGTAVLPTVRSAPRIRPALLIAVLATLLIVLAVAIALASSGGPSAPVHYPSVPGRLGTHLHQLEGAIG